MRQCYTLTSTLPEPAVLVFIARFLLSWGCSFLSKFLRIIRGASPQWEQVTGNEVNSAAQVESLSSLQNRILTMCQWMNTLVFLYTQCNVGCNQPFWCHFTVPVLEVKCVCVESSVLPVERSPSGLLGKFCGSWDCLILVFLCVFVGE